MACNDCFARNQKGHEKLVTKLHRNINPILAGVQDTPIMDGGGAKSSPV